MKYEKTKVVLNQLVADLSQLAMVVHQTHWYMRGTNFLKLHPLMDDWMDDLNDQLDEISERLIALDGSPYSTLSEMVEHTRLLTNQVTGIGLLRSGWRFSLRITVT